MPRIASPTAVARHLSFVRETLGPNRGAWVQKFQRETGGAVGDSWCADFVCFVLDICYGGHSPLPKSGACQDLLAAAAAHGQLVAEPLPDDLFFYTTAAGVAHHCGIITSVRPVLTAIAGNTSSDGQSDNGTGVYEHLIGSQAHSAHVFVRLP